MPNILRGLRIDTIGFVDRGANGASPVVLFKRHVQEQAMSLKEKIKKALDSTRESILDALAKEAPDADKTPAQLLEVALEGMPDDKKAAIMSAVAAMQQAPPPAPTPEVAPAPAPAPEAEKKAEGEGGEKPEEKMEKIMKGLPEDLPKEAREAIEKIAAASTERADKLTKTNVEEIKKLTEGNEALAKRLDETEDVVAKQTADREHGEMIEVAKRFPSLPGDFAERATMLTAVKKADKKGYDSLIKSLKAADELAKKGLGETGTARPGEGGGSAEAKLDTLAKSHAKDNNVSYAKAYKAVCKINRELYNEADAERQ